MQVKDIQIHAGENIQIINILGNPKWKGRPAEPGPMAWCNCGPMLHWG